MRALYASEGVKGGMENGGDDRLPPPNGDGVPEQRAFVRPPPLVIPPPNLNRIVRRRRVRPPPPPPPNEEAKRGGGVEREGVNLGLLQILARAAYPGRTPKKLGGFELIRGTPTLKIFKRGDLILVSIRGTVPSEKEDILADIATVRGAVAVTSRYIQDEKTLREVQREYPPSQFRYIGVGHSLGGAILDVFLRKGLVRNGLSFNPMVEPQERGGGTTHRRIYNERDPLYLLFGKNVPGVEVRKANDPLWKVWLTYKLPPVIKQIFTAYDSHRLQSFRGGAFDPTTYFKLTEPIIQKQRRTREKRTPQYENQPEVRVVMREVLNPDYDERKNPKVPPPKGRKGIKKRISVPEEIPTGKTRQVRVEDKVETEEYDADVVVGKKGTGDQIARLNSIMRNLRDLAHFYRFRDPAASLGFRVIADDIWEYMPLYEGTGDKREVDDTHAREQEQMGYKILGIGDGADKRPLPRPQDRYNMELQPLLAVAFDPKNPLRAVPKAGKNGYSVPPQNIKEAIHLLKDYPSVRPPTTMPYWFYP